MDSNLTAIAEEKGFVVMYPQGSQGDIGTGWNAGTCCVGEDIDDVGFLSAIFTLLNSTFSIRADSIHVSGFSNGGFMTERLGCEMSDLFTSIACVSGNTIVVWGEQQAFQYCDQEYKRQISVLHVHGNADFTVPFTGNALLGWADIPSDMHAWAARNNCTSVPPVNTFNISTFSNTLWQNCSASDEGVDSTLQVELVLNDGGGHEWPMEQGVWEVSNYIIEFFNRVTPGGI